MSNHYGPDGEYAGNLYTEAMGIVHNADSSNVFPTADYPHGIPVSVVRDNFAAHEHAAIDNAMVWPGLPGVSADGELTNGPDELVSTGYKSWARIADRKEHARFAADSADTRRQSVFLLDEYAAGLVGGFDGMHIFGAGHVADGGVAYLQLGTGAIYSPAGMSFSPVLTCYLGHNGTRQIGAIFGGNVFACANAVLSSIGGRVKSKQTKNLNTADMLAKHRVMLGLDTVAETLSAELLTMSEVSVSDAQWSAILDELAPVNVADASKHAETRNENFRQTITGMYRTDDRCKDWTGTLLGVTQTLDTFDRWERSTRGETDPFDRMMTEFLAGTYATKAAQRQELLTRVLATV